MPATRSTTMDAAANFLHETYTSHQELGECSANGSFMNQTAEASFNLLETMAMNSECRGSKRKIMRRQVAITDEDAIRALTEQVATLTL